MGSMEEIFCLSFMEWRGINLVSDSSIIKSLKNDKDMQGHPIKGYRIKQLKKIRKGELRQRYCIYFYFQVEMPMLWTEELVKLPYCSRFNVLATVVKCEHCQTYPHLNRFKGVYEK